MKLGMIQQWRSECFDYVKGKGLSFIEICRNYDPDAEEFIAHADEVKANVERTGVSIASVGRWNAQPNVGGKLDADVYDRMVRLMDAAHHVGSPVFVCGCNYDNSISLLKNYENAVEFFGMLCDIAKGSEVRVAIQNCDWNNFVVSEKHWEVVLGALPELYIKYDASHAYNRGEDYLAVLSNWGERVAHVHIKGTTHAGRRGVDDPPAGMDDINWSSLFSILYARKYDGDLSIEPHSATWLGELGNKGVLFTRDFIRKYML
jgi:sugar phosphate isomerase/epimerase